MIKMKYLIALSSVFMAFSCNQSNKTEDNNEMEKTIDSLITEMTLEEKIGMIHASSSFTSGGVERLGIPEMVMSDGPHGVRHEHGRDWAMDNTTDDSVSYLPTGIGLASTWNRELGYEYGKVLGNEARARGKDVILGPGINIIRSPQCGRNFEYLSEDPYLTAQMAIGYIKGVQEQGVAACAKHYVANNQETDRGEVDVKISEQALREIYLPAFKASVQQANVMSIMGAYNKVWGQHCSHHQYLVNQVLKDEYGFKGFLVSDWSAVHDTKEALLYGTDIEMGTDLTMLPNPDYSKFYLADSALAMVQRGEVEESIVDDKIRRILRVMYQLDMLKPTRPQGERNTPEHQNLALKVAEESMVLLKNEGILPLNPDKAQTIAVIGDNAIRKHAEEGGSSQVKALYEVTPLQGIKQFADNNTKITFAQGYTPTRENKIDKKLFNQAVEAARKADKVIFVGGWIHNFDAAVWGKDAFDSEGLDKKDLKLLFGQEKLIKALAKANPDLTVVIMGGSNVEMANWMGDAKAIIQAWYPGMEGGTALANIIFGKVNPSGKLPMTFGNSHLDYPAHEMGEFPGENLVVNYNDDIYVGYRYFETFNKKPLFPFGHGLSYTTFKFSNLKASQKSDEINISFNVKNSGDADGAEVAQLYIQPVKVEAKRPSKELKRFQKVFIDKEDEQTINFTLTPEDFSYFNEADKKWALADGTYNILIGNSVANIKLSHEITIE